MVFECKGLKWAADFEARTRNNFRERQKFVDSECIRYMTPYTPMRTGTLYRSATIGTVIGSGEIKQSTPYAKRCYYGDHINFNKTHHPQARSRWFEAMKKQYKDVILEGCRKIGD